MAYFLSKTKKLAASCVNFLVTNGFFQGQGELILTVRNVFYFGLCFGRKKGPISQNAGFKESFNNFIKEENTQQIWISAPDRENLDRGKLNQNQLSSVYLLSPTDLRQPMEDQIRESIILLRQNGFLRSLRSALKLRGPIRKLISAKFQYDAKKKRRLNKIFDDITKGESNKFQTFKPLLNFFLRCLPPPELNESQHKLNF